MNRLDKTIDDVRYTLECLTVLREIQETGDCNICKNRECAYRPSYGQLPRYNCPFYIKTEKDESLVDRIDAEIAKIVETHETKNTKELYIVSEERNYWQKAIKLTEEQARAIEWFINVTNADYYIKKASDVEEEVL